MTKPGYTKLVCRFCSWQTTRKITKGMPPARCTKCGRVLFRQRTRQQYRNDPGRSQQAREAVQAMLAIEHLHPERKTARVKKMIATRQQKKDPID